MHKHKRAVLLVLPAAVLLLSGSQAAAITKSFEGRKLYTTYCLVCHGEKGEGNGPLASKLKKRPADLTLSTRMESRSDLDLFRVIESGKLHETTMPGWKNVLAEAEIRAVVSYIRFLSH